MGTYFDINGTAMIYINTNPSIRNAKTKKEADEAINKKCQDLNSETCYSATCHIEEM